MERTIKIAARSNERQPGSHRRPPGPRPDRLVTEAAAAGAQLLVLPELFNTGYAYSDANHRLAEPLNGSTATWMKEAAARLNVHLAGTLMLLDHDEA
ncbi:MAG: nitrilase-related carbon-nitrogen hydrolase [Anaerolineae bacterium]